jgi:hypothetical protein
LDKIHYIRYDFEFGNANLGRLGHNQLMRIRNLQSTILNLKFCLPTGNLIHGGSLLFQTWP